MLVSGLVQGVYYRKFVQTNAIPLGLKGWVRNLYDERVELLVEGERGLIEELIKELRIGPPGADVKGVEIKWEEYNGEFKDFKITF